MHEPPSTFIDNAQVSSSLLAKAVPIYRRIKADVEAAGAALEQRNVLGAIGALDGTDRQLRELEYLLRTARDYFSDGK